MFDARVFRQGEQEAPKLLCEQILLSLRFLAYLGKLSIQVVHGIAAFTRACIFEKREVIPGNPSLHPLSSDASNLVCLRRARCSRFPLQMSCNLRKFIIHRPSPLDRASTASAPVLRSEQTCQDAASWPGFVPGRFFRSCWCCRK